MSDEYQKVKLNCTHGPDLHFEGRVLHEYTTQRKDGGKDRWTELRLWETPAGNWIAESVGMSSRQGEIGLREAVVIEAMGAFERGDAPVEEVAAALETWHQDRRVQVMGAFGWTTAAKAFAREMGWDVIRRVD